MKLWIARNRWDGLELFTNKPIAGRGSWFTEENNEFELNSNAFPEVTFENPQEIEIQLVK